VGLNALNSLNLTNGYSNNNKNNNNKEKSKPLELFKLAGKNLIAGQVWSVVCYDCTKSSLFGKFTFNKLKQVGTLPPIIL
jgi:hypothetical protein